MALHVLGQLVLRLAHLAARRGGVDGGEVEQLAVLVEHRHLAAGAVARVDGDDARAAHGALRKQALGVLGEHLDGVGLRALGEEAAHLAVERGGHEALVAVGRGLAQHGGEGACRVPDHAALELFDGGVCVHAHLRAQLALLLAAVHGEHAVVGDARERLREVVVRLVDGLLLRVDRFHGQRAGALGEAAQGLGVLGVVGDDLGHDVLGALQRRLGRGEAGLGVHEPGREVERRFVGAALRQDEQRKGLQPRVARLRRAGGALLLVRLVQVLHALHDRGVLDLRAQLGRELALLVDGAQHLVLAGLEVAQIG